VSAELEARKTAANALLADFHDLDPAALDGWQGGVWAFRLASMLGKILDALDQESPQ
jgi:hypothetical protein